MNTKAKEKLIEARKTRGFTQQDVANELCIDVSCYSKRESGHAKIRIEEWVKIAKVLNVPVETIYEEDEKHSFTFKDNATGNHCANGLVITVPEFFIETQRKYVQKLEEENAELKQLLMKK